MVLLALLLQGQEKKDSRIRAVSDTASTRLQNDSLQQDTTPKKIGNLYLPEDKTFESKVEYNAKDSIKYDLQNRSVLLYGDAQVNYGDIELKAAFIEYGFASNQVLAVPFQDTTGELIGKPVFTDKGQNYDADTIRYNFKTKRGIIKNVSTNISDGHVYGETVKRTEDDILYIKAAEFCPCEDKNARTRIHAQKLKFIPNKKILSSAWVLKLGKVPTPLAFFFGYFPNSEKKNAGIIIPRYGDSPDLGFFLADFGWYQPIGEKFDAKILGTVYTKGSWNTATNLRYKNNYRYSGNLDLLYQVTKRGFRQLESSFSETRDFKINWNHRQDPKARPNSSFNSLVNIGTSTVNQNNLNSSAEEFLTNTFRSNVNYSKSFAGKPYNLALSASHDQNTRTRAVNINLPQFTFNLSRFYLPLGFLKSKDNAKTEWFEKIGVNYNFNFNNRLSVFEQDMRFDNTDYLLSQMQNGIRHNANINTSLKKWFFTFNPGVTMTSRNYFRKFERRFDNELQQVVVDTIPGFYNVYDYGFNMAVTTNVYGMFTYKRGPLKAIRHLMTPNATFFYRPGSKQYYKSDFVGGTDGQYTTYSPFTGQIFGVPSPNESAGINLSLSNNLEAKVRDRKDTTGTGTKKIKLLEALNFSTSHDFLRDSIKWNNVVVNARTNIIKTLSLNYSANLDPYGYDTLGVKINESLLSQRGKVIRFANQNFALNYSYRPGMYKNKEREESRDSSFVSKLYYGIQPEISVAYNYSINQLFNDTTQAFDDNITPHTISLSGSIDFFGKVQLRYSTGYDIIAKEFSFTQFNLYVDLNCWEFSANFVPFGNIKSYSLSINMKSALLKDVKLERNRTFNDNAQF